MTNRDRRRRDRAKSLLHGLFVGGQRVGVDVLPRHFYSGIPDIRELRQSTTWRAPHSLVGLAGFEVDTQLELLRSWFQPEVRTWLAAHDVHQDACRANGEVGFGPSEATVLHAFVATEKPRRVVQIGAGVSTAVVLAAAEQAGYEVEIVCVDPFPTDHLTRLDREGRIRLDRRPAQEVELDVLTALQDGDLLFVDSTHTVKPGSEVNRLVLEVLPRLDAGVWAHFHDIWFPYDYARDVLTAGLFFWLESTLLHAYLVDNRRVTTKLCESWLHYQAPKALAELVPGYTADRNQDGLQPSSGSVGHFPSSIYLRVEADAPSRRRG